MKKTLAAISIALLAFSCAQKEPEVPEIPGTQVSFTARAQEDPESKMSLTGKTGSKYHFAWNASDAVRLFTYTPGAAGEVTDWGDFVTATGGESASFTGTMPGTRSGSAMMAFYSPSTDDWNVTWSAGNSRYETKFNIPSGQDGTGTRYSLFAAQPAYDSGTGAIGDASFSLRSCITYLTLPESADVRRMTVTVSASIRPESQFLCSTGGNEDITLNCSGFYLSGGTNKTITVYNGGSLLSGQVYFASRQTTGNDTNGYAILQFVFENGDGLKARKTLKLATGVQPDATATTYRNLTAGFVNKLGTVVFGEGDFQWEGSFSELTLVDEETASPDRIPDFSRVGYKYGDEAIPSRAVARTITVADVASALAAGTASDTTDYIQKAIDAVGGAGGGAILLKNGTYNVSRILFIDKDNVVLRGESEAGTVLKSAGTAKVPVVFMGKTLAWGDAEESSPLTNMAGRRVGISSMKAAGTGGSSSFGSVTLVSYSPKCPTRSDNGSNSFITEDYVPLGRLYVEVANPRFFSVGDPVRIYRPGTAEWIEDIGMDKIADNGRSAAGSPTVQWTPSAYSISWTRVVTAVSGNRVYLDAPVAHSLDRRYGESFLQKYSLERVTGCGVENLTFDCIYDSSVRDGSSREVDERHAWIAVQVKAAQHCWIRNVSSRHMGYALADLNYGARCITVQDCSSYTPVSVVQGARRYAFVCSPGAELCLVKDCYCNYDRHSFVTNGTVAGPNVFTNCRSENGYNAIGPHYGYATATLYDKIVADTNFEAQDGGCQGTGHGWRGVNTVFWNVSGEEVVAQNVWATCPECGTQYNRSSVCRNCGAPTVYPSARNYAVGVSGTKRARTLFWDKDYYGNATTDYFVDLFGYGSHGENRPDGEWYPALDYDADGSSPVSLPVSAGVSWWPEFSLSSFSTPTSLYECQLEDRHARGIYLNTL